MHREYVAYLFVSQSLSLSISGNFYGPVPCTR